MVLSVDLLDELLPVLDLAGPVALIHGRDVVGLPAPLAGLHFDLHGQDHDAFVEVELHQVHGPAILVQVVGDRGL